jgi:monoamine oxidase
MMTIDAKNNEIIAQLKLQVCEQKSVLKKHYEQLLAQDLSQQQSEGCFQRNVLIVLQQFYDDELVHLKTLPFDASTSRVNQGLSELTKQVLYVFDGFIDEFLLVVVEKHRTSCALSNFLSEHKPEKAYVQAVRRDIAEVWSNFATQINAHLLGYE